MFSEFPTFAETPDSMKPFILSFISLFLAFSLLAGNRAVRLSGADAIVHEWRADWIGAPWDGESFDKNAVPPAPEFRKEIVLNGRISKAVLHVTGLGFFEFFINGEKVGDDLLCPNETSYSSRPTLGKGSIPMDDSRFRGFRVLYLSYDVTRMLHKGGNVLGALLGNGFFSTDAARWVASYGTPRLLCQLELTYRDGRQETIVSGEDWEVRKSGILLLCSSTYAVHIPRSFPLFSRLRSGMKGRGVLPRGLRDLLSGSVPRSIFLCSDRTGRIS